MNLFLRKWSFPSFPLIFSDKPSTWKTHFINWNVHQILSHVWLFVHPWTVVQQTALSLTISNSLPRSCPLNRWCYPNLSSPLTYSSSCFQHLLKSGCFLANQLFSSDGHSFWALFSATVLPMILQSWFTLGFTCLIFLLSRGLSQVLHSKAIQNLQFFGILTSLHVLGKAIDVTLWTSIGQVMS